MGCWGEWGGARLGGGVGWRGEGAAGGAEGWAGARLLALGAQAREEVGLVLLASRLALARAPGACRRRRGGRHHGRGGAAEQLHAAEVGADGAHRLHRREPAQPQVGGGGARARLPRAGVQQLPVARPVAAARVREQRRRLRAVAMVVAAAVAVVAAAVAVVAAAVNAVPAAVAMGAAMGARTAETAGETAAPRARVKGSITSAEHVRSRKPRHAKPTKNL